MSGKWNLNMFKKDLKIVYLGTPKISAIVLENLIINGYNIVGIVSQVDKPQGRKMIVKPTETKLIGEKYNIPVFQPVKIRDDYAFLKELEPDIILTMAYGQIIPQAVLDIPKIMPLNLHGSILPKYRGASPIQQALLNGDKTTGITLMEMVDKMDAGKMFFKKEIAIEEDDNYESLSNKLAKLAYEVFDEGIQDLIDGKNKGEDQDESLVSFTRKIKSEESIIDFNEDSFLINNKIRAFYPDPGTYFVFNNEKIKVAKAKVIHLDHKKEPGVVIKYDKKEFIVACSKNALSIEILQKPGKKMMSHKDFYNGDQKLFCENEKIK